MRQEGTAACWRTRAESNSGEVKNSSLKTTADQEEQQVARGRYCSKLEGDLEKLNMGRLQFWSSFTTAGEREE